MGMAKLLSVYRVNSSSDSGEEVGHEAAAAAAHKAAPQFGRRQMPLAASADNNVWVNKLRQYSPGRDPIETCPLSLYINYVFGVKGRKQFQCCDCMHEGGPPHWRRHTQLGRGKARRLTFSLLSQTYRGA